MSILNNFLGREWQKKAPVTEDVGTYFSDNKVSNNSENNQTFDDFCSTEYANMVQDATEQYRAWQQSFTPTSVALNETPPITKDEALYTAAPIATTPPPITTETPPNVNITDTPIYYNFPVTVMAGFMDDPGAAMRRAIAWATYEQTKRMKTIERGRDRLYFALKDMDYEVEDQEEWYNFCGETYRYYKGPRTGISRKMYFEVYNVGYLPTRDKVLFLAFLAAKSIVGDKPYRITCNRQMCARMNGRATTYASEEEMREQSHPWICAYFTRKRWPRMREDMEKQYRVATYSQKNMRGYAVSMKMPLTKLAAAVERKRAKNKASYADRMREAGDNARAYIAQQRE